MDLLKKITAPKKAAVIAKKKAAKSKAKGEDERFEYNARNQILYEGYNAKPNADTSKKTWVIKKRIYKKSLISRKQTLFNVAWDDRTTLFVGGL